MSAPCLARSGGDFVDHTIAWDPGKYFSQTVVSDAVEDDLLHGDSGLAEDDATAQR